MLFINFWKTDTFVMYSHSTQEQGMSLYLFMSTYVSFRHILKCSLYKFCTFLIRRISKHFLFLNAVINGVLSSIIPFDCICVYVCANCWFLSVIFCFASLILFFFELI